ncbi:hypothetical protein [Streptomyces sp. NPDC004376]
MTSIPPTPHATHEDGTPLGVQLFTIAGTGLGPYVGLPITSLWFDDTPHLFTRETITQIANDVARDDLLMSYSFAADDTLTLRWSADNFDALGRVVIVVPDVHGRYLFGGMWPWAVWGYDDTWHTAGQAAFARGAAEYREAATTPYPDDLAELYARGREEAHRVTLRIAAP